MPLRGSSRRLIPLLSALSFGLLPSPGSAQTKDETPVILEAPVNGFMGMGSSFSLTRVDPAGSAFLSLSKNFPADVAKAIGSLYPEGYYVLLAPVGNDPNRFDAYRAQITEVGEGGEFTVAVSPEAAAKLKPGDGFSFVRPIGATTARMRDLPGVIPFVKPPGDQTDPDKFARRARSINNLKQIGLGMHNFHSTFNKFPAAVIYGPDGKPWHSWRVLILPYIENNDLFNQYDFNQPWDSEKNRKLIPKMPDVYRDPAYGDAKGSSAHYAALVGPTALFPDEGAKQPSNVGASVPMGEGGRGLAWITDGTSNTWAVAPVEPAREIPWTKPDDIAVGPDFPGLGKPGGIATPYTIGCKPDTPGVRPILYADGSVHLISATINPRVLAALLTHAGGEVIAQDAVPQDVSPAPRSRMLKIRIVGKRAAATLE